MSAGGAPEASPARRGWERLVFGLFGREEEVVGGIRDAHILTSMRAVATWGGSLASLRVKTLDRSNSSEDAFPAVAHHRYQEPRDGVVVGRRRIGCGFSGDAAAVIRFPCGSGVVLAERLAVLVCELRFRTLQRPGELRSAFLAGVDLIALGVDLQKKLFVGRRSQFLRHLLRAGRKTRSDEHCGRRKTECIGAWNRSSGHEAVELACACLLQAGLAGDGSLPLHPTAGKATLAAIR
jgi:hypothetical protein